MLPPIASPKTTVSGASSDPDNLQASLLLQQDFGSIIDGFSNLGIENRHDCEKNITLLEPLSLPGLHISRLGESPDTNTIEPLENHDEDVTNGPFTAEPEKRSCQFLELEPEDDQTPPLRFVWDSARGLLPPGSGKPEGTLRGTSEELKEHNVSRIPADDESDCCRECLFDDSEEINFAFLGYFESDEEESQDSQRDYHSCLFSPRASDSASQSPLASLWSASSYTTGRTTPNSDEDFGLVDDDSDSDESVFSANYEDQLDAGSSSDEESELGSVEAVSEHDDSSDNEYEGSDDLDTGAAVSFEPQTPQAQHRTPLFWYFTPPSSPLYSPRAFWHSVFKCDFRGQAFVEGVPLRHILAKRKGCIADPERLVFNGFEYRLPDGFAVRLGDRHSPAEISKIRIRCSCTVMTRAHLAWRLASVLAFFVQEDPTSSEPISKLTLTRFEISRRSDGSFIGQIFTSGY